MESLKVKRRLLIALICSVKRFWLRRFNCIATQKRKSMINFALRTILMNRLSNSIFHWSRETMSGTIFFLLIVGVLHMSTTNYELELVNSDLGHNSSQNALFYYCFHSTDFKVYRFQHLCRIDKCIDGIWHRAPILLCGHIHDHPIFELRRCDIRIGMVQISTEIAESCPDDHRRCAETSHLSWFWSY